MKKDISYGFAPPHTLSSLSPDAPILVGFSGGADSRFLLHVLSEYSAKNGTPLFLAHLNHGIRGAEADRDEAFCRQIAAGYGIPLFCERADVPLLASQSGDSLELQARKSRYDFFDRVMRENDIPLLATAHNADDVLETMLFRLMRGTGTKGLCAIPPVRPLGGGRLAIRPILSYTKREIVELCEALELEYVTDSTNFEEDCTRNKLRLSVIPELEKISGEGVIQRSALRYSFLAREDEEALTCLALAQINPDEPSKIQTEKLNSLHRGIAKRVIFKLYASLFADDGESIPEDKSLSNAHAEAIILLAKNNVKHTKLDLPDKAIAEIEDGYLVFSKGEKSFCDNTFINNTVSEGYTKINPHFSVLVENLGAGAHPLKKDERVRDGRVFASAIFPASDVGLPLGARPRQGGDVIRSHGMTKKIKKMLCDKGIPIEIRDALPLFTKSDGEILWCPSVAVCDGYPPPHDGAALRLTVIISDV